MKKTATLFFSITSKKAKVKGPAQYAEPEKHE